MCVTTVEKVNVFLFRCARTRSLIMSIHFETNIVKLIDSSISNYLMVTNANVSLQIRFMLR